MSDLFSAPSVPLAAPLAAANLRLAGECVANALAASGESAESDSFAAVGCAADFLVESLVRAGGPRAAANLRLLADAAARGLARVAAAGG